MFIFVNLCTIKVDIFINGGKNMPDSNNRMTQEQFENEQMESFNRMRSNIQARIVELEGAVEGSNEYDELQQLRNDLNDL